MNIRYRVTLSEEERMTLQEILGRGRSQVCEVKRAQILLATDQGAIEGAIARAVRTSAATIYRTKLCIVEQGLVSALHEAHRPVVAASSPAWRKPCSLPRPVRRRPQDGRAVRSSCWSTRWSA